MASAWSEEEVSKLIDLWGDDVIQAQLEGCKRNKEVFEKILRGMTEAGYQRSATQCREKVKKLRADYKRIKDNNNLSGRDRKTSKIFEKLDEILGQRPATKPEVVIDSSLSVDPEDNSIEVLNSTSEFEDTVADEVHKEQRTQESVSDTIEIQRKGSNEIKMKQEGIKKRKRSATRDEKMEKILDSVITNVSKMQEKSDAQFYELEQKRIKMEEHILKMEEQRYKDDKDRAQRQRREERDFQLKVIQMLSGQPPLPTQAHLTLHPESGQPN